MPGHFFISYSSVDGKGFSLRLADELAAGPPAFSIWLDERNLRPDEDWDEQIVEAIRVCKALVFVMTKDSVSANSVCKAEWVRALRYKKPVIPLLLHTETELPFRLGARNYIDFTGSFDNALARLRKHLSWMDSPEGQLQALRHRLADARREYPRVNSERQARIREDIAELEQEIKKQEEVIANPQAARQRVQETIDRGLERERQLGQPEGKKKRSKFINPPPLVAPTWFQDRHVETQLIGDFLKDDALRLMTLVGRGGVGKSAMVCRLLHSLEGGRLPDDGGPLAVDGIVYLSNARAFHRTNVPDLFTGLSQLLSEETCRQLEAVYKNPHAGTQEIMQAISAAFPGGRTVVLLDNFEDVVNMENGEIEDAELDEALRALLQLPPHGLKLIITTRIAPRKLAMVEPGRQRRLDLDSGLERPYAENVLRVMDADGKVGLRDAPDNLLAQARERTRGYPRALEHLFGILSADRDSSLQEILDNTEELLPEQVVEVLVGEAFSRLGLNAQRVMKALATFRYPASAPAVDYLLQPYIPGVDSGPVLSRLVNMQFARRDAGRYYLHQIDRDYADSRIPAGEPADREKEGPPFSRFALRHRAAEWFKLARKPREAWKTLEDLAPQLAEFELRCAGEDYDTAAAVLVEIDFDYLMLWGNYRLMAELHERLEGKTMDLGYRQMVDGNLGMAYYRMGKYKQAITYTKRALEFARERDDLWSEGVLLGTLGNSYSELGKAEKALEFCKEALAISRQVKDPEGEALALGNIGNQYVALGQAREAIEYYEKALVIDRRIKDRRGEAIDLNNLGNQYLNLGEVTEAMKYYQEALDIGREIGFRLVEAAALSNVGRVFIERKAWEQAIQACEKAIEIADDIASIHVQHEARGELARAHLYNGNPSAAIDFAAGARKYDFPLGNHQTSAILGVAALLKGESSAACKAFTRALRQAGELLQENPQSHPTLETLGLAYSGLALCKNIAHLPTAKEAYQSARAINSDAGVVARALRLFDALAQADKTGVLAEVRPAVMRKGGTP